MARVSDLFLTKIIFGGEGGEGDGVSEFILL